MRHYHGPIDEPRPSRLADWAIRILVTAICLACSLGWGCYRDPVTQIEAELVCYDVDWQPLPADRCVIRLDGCGDELIYQYGVNDACFGDGE